MKALPSPVLARLLAALCLASLAAACVEPSRRSGIVDSLNSVSFAPPPGQAGPAGLVPAGGAAAGPGSGEAAAAAALPGAEVYGGAQRRATGSRAGGQQARRAEDGVTLNFDRADVGEAVRVILGDVLQRPYTIDPAVSGQVTLSSTGPIAEADLLNVLEAMLRANNATLVDIGDGTFQVVPLENAPARAEVAPLGGRAPTLRPGYGVTVVPLRNISASAAAQFIQPLVSTPEDIRIDTARNLLLFAGTNAERQSAVDVLADLDVNWLADKAVGIFPLRVSTPEAVIPELNSIFGSLDPAAADVALVRFVPVARLNAVLAVGTNPGQIEEVERWVARLDRGGRTVGNQFYVYNLKYVPAEEVAKLLNEAYSEGPASGLGDGLGPAPAGPAALSPFGPGGGRDGGQDEGEIGDVSEQGQFGQNQFGQNQFGQGQFGQGPGGLPPADGGGSAGPASYRLPGGVRVVPNRANNSLLIRATPQAYETIEGTLIRLDVAPLQVLIEATIVEVALNDQLRYGVQYFFETNGFRFGFNSNAGSDTRILGETRLEPSAIIPGFNFIFSGGSSNVTIDALARLTDVKVLSSPSVVVVDNREATLTVGNEVPITTRTAVGIDDADAPIVNSVEYRNTGVILQVRPRINADGAVSLEIAQEVSRVDPSSGSDTLTPTFIQRKITSRINVQNNQTVVLGGLIEDAENRGRDRIPVLGEIPIVGNLFGTTVTQDRRTELIVFLTPRVIRNADDHRDVSEELRARLRTLRPYAPEAALPPVPLPPGRREAVPPATAPAYGPRPVVPPGTLGQVAPAAGAPTPAAPTPAAARAARSQGVPEEWLPELVGTAPPADRPRPPAADEDEEEELPALTGGAEEDVPEEAAGDEAAAAAAVAPPVEKPPAPPPAPEQAAEAAAVALAAAAAPAQEEGAQAGFDIARAPIPRLRPFAHAPEPPRARPAAAGEGG